MRSEGTRVVPHVWRLHACAHLGRREGTPGRTYTLLYPPELSLYRRSAPHKTVDRMTRRESDGDSSAGVRTCSSTLPSGRVCRPRATSRPTSSQALRPNQATVCPSTLSPSTLASTRYAFTVVGCYMPQHSPWLLVRQPAAADAVVQQGCRRGCAAGNMTQFVLLTCCAHAKRCHLGPGRLLR